MKITNHNYEEYLMDYLDGKLNSVEAGELMLFLSEHPEIEEEFSTLSAQKTDYKEFSFSKENIVFENKKSLQKTHLHITEINEKNIDDFIIANLEGDLHNEQVTKLNRYIENHPDVKKNIGLYEKVYYKPDLSVTYAYKNALKKQAVFHKTRRILIYSLSAAAVILLFLSIFFNTQKPEQAVKQIVVTRTNAEEKNEITASVNDNIITNKKESIPETRIQKETPVAENVVVKEKIELPVLHSKKPVIRYSDKNPELPALWKNSPYTAKNEDTEEQQTDEIFVIRYYPNFKSNVLSVLDIGITAFNKLTESEINVTHETGEKGKTKIYALDSGIFKFYQKNN